MTHSYSEPLAYEVQENNLYSKNSNVSAQKSTCVPATIIGSVVGGGVGAFAGYKTNPFIAKNKDVSDTFAKAVYNKCMQGAQTAEKEAYNESLNILKKIKKVRSAEELKALFNENKKAIDSILSELKTSLEDFFVNINKQNLEANKKTIREKINADNNMRYQNIKNKILSCWNKEKKEFIKSNSVDDNIYESIKSSMKGIKTKTIVKFALIGAAAAGILTFITAKILSKKSS